MTGEDDCRLFGLAHLHGPGLQLHKVQAKPRTQAYEVEWSGEVW